MTANITIDDLVKQVATNSGEIAELQKTLQTTGDYPGPMQIVYSDVLQTKTFEKAPFLRFLESKGQVFDNEAALIGYFKENREQSDVKWIGETGDIPDANAETITEVTEKMKTIVAPIEVSMMAQMGNYYTNLLERRQDQKFIEVNTMTDAALLEGTGSDSTKDFKGITSTITTHTEDMKGDKITESVIDDMLEDLYNDNSNPDVMVCSYGVAKQLKDLIQPNQRNFLSEKDIGLGHRVISYFSMEGTELPILVDRNFDTTDGDKLAIVDSSTIEVRRLMPPTVIPNIPVNKLAFKNVIAAFLTAQNIGEFKDGIITGIGDGTPITEGNPETPTTDVTVTVTDGTDAIEGAVVTLTDNSDNEYSTSDSGTGSAGGATITAVPYGSYSVTATKNGYTDYESTSNVTIDADNHSISITMTAT